MKTYTRTLIPRAQKMRREMTRAEARLWFEVLKDFEPRVRRQRPIGGYIADFYCAACKVMIEVDGDSHFTQGGLEYDTQRTVFLESLGLRCSFLTLMYSRTCVVLPCGSLRCCEELLEPVPLETLLSNLRGLSVDARWIVATVWRQC